MHIDFSRLAHLIANQCITVTHKLSPTSEYIHALLIPARLFLHPSPFTALPYPINLDPVLPASLSKCKNENNPLPSPFAIAGMFRRRRPSIVPPTALRHKIQIQRPTFCPLTLRLSVAALDVLIAFVALAARAAADNCLAHFRMLG